MINTQDVILRMNDYLSNYTIGQADEDQKLRAVDYATNLLNQKLGNNQDKYTFNFFQDTIFYDVPTTFKEYIGLIYSDVNKNVQSNTWTYRPYQEVARIAGNGFGNFVSVTKINNGSNQLAMSGVNLMQGATIDTFDDTLWTASSDASAIAFDYNIKVQGSASQKFTITDSSGDAKVARNSLNLDFTSLHNNEGALKIYSYLTSVDFTSIKIRYGNGNNLTSTNYYTISVTENADGSDWELNDWNLLGFLSENKVITGSPDESDINFIEVWYELDVAFGTATNMRLDWLYSSFPDEMELLFYTNIKGEDVSGDPISKITATTDLINADDDYIEMIALKGAIYLFPQLRADPGFMQLYGEDYKDMIKLFARANPRIRAQNNYMSTRLRR